MRILQLTPGTATFFCGSCLRDATLVKALRALGHDAVMAPLYLPLALEEPLTSDPVRLGGINVYLRHKLRALPVPRFVQDLLDSPGLLRLAAGRSNMTGAADHAAMTVDLLAGENGDVAQEIAKLVSSLRASVRPEVVLLSNALLLGLARSLKEALGAPLLCTLQGEAPFLDSLPEPFRSRAWQLLGERGREVDGFLAVSRYTAELMSERAGLERSKVHVVPNGIELDGLAPAASASDPPVVGYVARLCRDKGLPVLVEAFLALREVPRFSSLRLVVVGTMIGADQRLVAELQGRIRAAGAQDAVEFHPNADRAKKLACLKRMTVFSVPATYGESFGLYVLEALACGIPVVEPRHGGLTELVEATGGGVLVEPDDTTALADGIARLLDDPARARGLGLTGQRAVARDFSAERMARDVERVCRMTATARTMQPTATTLRG